MNEMMLKEIEEVLKAELAFAQNDAGIYQKDIEAYGVTLESAKQELSEAIAAEEYWGIVLILESSQDVVRYDEFSKIYNQLEKFDWFEENYQEVEAWINEHVKVDVTLSKLLDEKVLTNIIVRSSDGEFDFPECDREEEAIGSNGIRGWAPGPEDSSLMWLSMQQGYAKRDLDILAIDPKSEPRGELLRTIVKECENALELTNDLVFLVKMSFGDLIRIVDPQLNFSEGKLTIQPNAKLLKVALSQDTICGLANFCFETTGGMQVKLEKPVEIPGDILSLKLENAMIPSDFANGIGIIYELEEDAWHESLVKIEVC